MPEQFLSMLPDNVMYPALLGWGWGMGLMTPIPPPPKKKNPSEIPQTKIKPTQTT